MSNDKSDCHRNSKELDLMTRRNEHMWGQGTCGISGYLLLNFVVNLKMLQKVLIIIIICYGKTSIPGKANL